MKHALFFVCAVFLGSLSRETEAEWVSFGGPPGTPPEVRVSHDDAGETILELQLYGFEYADTTIEGETYSIVALPGEAQLHTRGYPVLPKVTKSIIIPDLAHMEIEVRH